MMAELGRLDHIKGLPGGGTEFPRMLDEFE
jgi:hypothetical protein